MARRAAPGLLRGAHSVRAAIEHAALVGIDDRMKRGEALGLRFAIPAVAMDVERAQFGERDQRRSVFDS